MITIQEYLLSKSKPRLNMIKATDETIHQIVKDELDRLGHDADLNHIDVSEVTNMNRLFSCAHSHFAKKYQDLNPDISRWDVSKVIDMQYMFYWCENFNQDLSKWDVSKVQDMEYMFCFCDKFNQDLSKWDVSIVENMEGMFYGCKYFNIDISQWVVSKVENMKNMFYQCKKFNQDLSEWNVKQVKNYNCMFNHCHIKEEFKPKFKD